MLYYKACNTRLVSEKTGAQVALGWRPSLAAVPQAGIGLAGKAQ